MSEKKSTVIYYVLFGLFFVLLLGFIILMGNAQAEEAAPYTVMVVTGDHVREREEPSLDAYVTGHYDTGDKVEVVVIENGWAELKNGYYVKASFLTDDLTAAVNSRNFYVIAPGVRERKAPSTGEVVCEHLAGDVVLVDGDPVDGWYKLTNGNYISAEFVSQDYMEIFRHCAEHYKDILIVSISMQHAAFYHYDAQRESDVVTGKPSVSPTPLGLTQAGRKVEGVFLNNNEDTYIDSGVYFRDRFLVHDADDFPWRKTGYGGNIYITNGSGGCVNAPREFARYFHDNCTECTYVLIIQ